MDAMNQIQDLSTRVVELETALSACEARSRQLEETVEYQKN
jgi:hypothetical protein